MYNFITNNTYFIVVTNRKIYKGIILNYIMKKTRLTVNITRKTLAIDGKPMRLEDTFTDAYIDHAGSEEPVLNLEYKGRFSEDNSPIEIETDKLSETYGTDLFKRLNVSGSMLEEAHYLSFYGDIDPAIEKPTRQCYDILEPLENRNRRTTP